MRTYQFRALCASGEWRDFECEAENFAAARVLLDEFIRNN